jgi:hypothetical protein
MFTIQILVALAVVVGVAVAWVLALKAAGAIWQRDQARLASAAASLTPTVQLAPEADETRELVLR